MRAASPDILAVGYSVLALAEAYGVTIAEVIQAASERLVAGRLRHDAATGVPVVPEPEMPREVMVAVQRLITLGCEHGITLSVVRRIKSAGGFEAETKDLQG
jgi:hypothetical protein